MFSPSSPCFSRCNESILLPPETKQTKILRKHSNLSSSVIWCHQVVSVISTPLKTREEAGNRREEWCWGWREQHTIAWMLKSMTLPQHGLFPNLEGHYASEEFYLQIKNQNCLDGNIKVGMAIHLVFSFLLLTDITARITGVYVLQLYFGEIQVLKIRIPPLDFPKVSYLQNMFFSTVFWYDFSKTERQKPPTR